MKREANGGDKGSKKARRKDRWMTSLFAIISVSAIASHASDAADPAPVRLTEKALTTQEAQERQKAWANHLGFEVVFKNSIGMPLRVIPPGTYRTTPRAEDDGPIEIKLSQPFLIGQFEVTQREWKRVMGPIETELDAGVGDRFPIYRINHAEASDFCRKLTQLEREAGKLPAGYEYRLPTNGEREFACRAGTLTRHHFGDKMSSRLANYDGTRPLEGTEKGPNLGQTTEVGTYPANAWGLHDMHGNLAEWCMDWYQKKQEGGVDPVRLKPSPGWENEMVIRGSGWGYPGAWVHSANRYHAPADVRRPTIGFRPVLTRLETDRAAEPGKEKGDVGQSAKE
ncbi:MAG: formylglycine-generating enzyme family protein [Verrucomicrobiales bacterium]